MRAESAGADMDTGVGTDLLGAKAQQQQEGRKTDSRGGIVEGCSVWARSLDSGCRMLRHLWIVDLYVVYSRYKFFFEGSL